MMGLPSNFEVKTREKETQKYIDQVAVVNLYCVKLRTFPGCKINTFTDS